MQIIQPLAVLLIAAALLASGSARADAELRDRYILASQKMGENMLKVIEACAADLDTSDIDFDYTPRMTEAVGCIIDKHIQRYGRDETVALVEDAEAMGERSFSSLQDMASIQQEYPRLATPGMMEITQQCGVIEASRDLPLTKLMQDNMATLAPCFTP